MSHYDVVVVGGGINGAGVAQAAAAAGYSVLLLEKSSPGAGTSGASSKLIHGGLRYLESYEFHMVHESLYERAILLRNAPELVKIKPFFVPVYKGMRRPPWMIRLGLSLYAVLGGLGRNNRFRSVKKDEWGSLDGLKTDELKAVFCYKDAQTDDSELTKAVVASAVSLGAETAIPGRFLSARIDSPACDVEYELDDQKHSCTATTIVNAAGPWINKVLDHIEPQQQQVPIDLIRGSHIVVNQETKQGMYYVESPRDGRAIFLMPWHDNTTMIGTTETKFKQHPDNVQPLQHEISYLLNIACYYFPRFQQIRPTDLVDSFAGLRVLPSKDGHVFHRSREVVFTTDRPKQPRLINIYGGKLTTYRATAQKTLKKILPTLPESKPRADTRQLPLQPVD